MPSLIISFLKAFGLRQVDTKHCFDSFSPDFDAIVQKSVVQHLHDKYMLLTCAFRLPLLYKAF